MMILRCFEVVGGITLLVMHEVSSSIIHWFWSGGLGRTSRV